MQAAAAAAAAATAAAAVAEAAAVAASSSSSVAAAAAKFQLTLFPSFEDLCYGSTAIITICTLTVRGSGVNFD